jgi:OmpA-OmpF porin, OOP family
VTIHKTNPLKPDTDGGSIVDGEEVTRGTNPLDRSDDVPRKDEIKVQAGKAIVLDGISFATGKWNIAPAAAQTLELDYATLAENPGIRVEIRGYTDIVGNKSLNLKLSEKRAQTVREWLIKKGIGEDRITATGLGPANPIGDNKTASGRQKNRRVEFVRLR